MQILLIRHGESTGNREGRLQGQAEFDLSEVGRQQVHQLAQRFVSEGWVPSQVYCSPLRRAVQTAEILVDEAFARGNREIDIAYRDELKEINNGIFAGLTWGEAQQRYPELCQRLEGSLELMPIPGAESLGAVRDRAQQFLQSLLQDAGDGDRISIISHGGFLQHLIAELMGCERSWGMVIPPTALFEFCLARSQWNVADQPLNTALWRIERFNDCQHLQNKS